MVKYVTFNHHYMGSNPIDLKFNGYRLMVDHSSSKRCVSIRIRLAVKYIMYDVKYIIYNIRYIMYDVWYMMYDM